MAERIMVSLRGNPGFRSTKNQWFHELPLTPDESVQVEAVEAAPSGKGVAICVKHPTNPDLGTKWFVMYAFTNDFLKGDGQKKLRTLLVRGREQEEQRRNKQRERALERVVAAPSAGDAIRQNNGRAYLYPPSRAPRGPHTPMSPLSPQAGR